MSRHSSYWLRYLGHLALILLVLFVGYWIGDKLWDFKTGGTLKTLLKMYLWFFALLVGADLLFERWLKV